MDIRRVLIRIFKFFLTLILIWVLLAVTWIALPSRQRDDAFDSDALNGGKVLGRVYELATFYPWADETPAVREARRSFRSHMSLDIKLEKGTGDQNYTLVLGTRHDSFAYILAGADRLLPYQNISLTTPDEDANISVSGPLPFFSRTADDICHPDAKFRWINTAERTLSCWWVSHDWYDRNQWSEVAPTAIRTRIIPAENTIEVWPESYYWRLPDSEWHPPKMGPFLTVKLSENDEPTFTFHPTSASPSAFYRVRLAMLPVLYIGYLFAEYLVYILYVLVGYLHAIALSIALIFAWGVLLAPIRWYLRQPIALPPDDEPNLEDTHNHSNGVRETETV